MPEHPANWLARVRGPPGAPSGRVIGTDAWGEDDLPADQQPHISGHSGQLNNAAEEERGLQGVHRSKRTAQPGDGRPILQHGNLASYNPAEPAPSTEPGPSTLQSMCLGCLGTYVVELVEAGADAVSMLTADHKASLLAVARRMGVLDDMVLEALVDEEWSVLDVSVSAVTDKCLRRALLRLPRLLHLDLTSLKDCCPKLQTLRLGCDGIAIKAAETVLPSLVPCISQQENTSADSWEEAGEPQSQRLADLRHLIWPLLPQAAEDGLLRLCPRLAINPDEKRLRGDPLRGRKPLPVEADWTVPLDAIAAAAVGQFDWDALRRTYLQEAGVQQPQLQEKPQAGADRQLAPGELSIADRFKLAYEQRAQRIALKAERNRRQARRRYLRDNPSQQLILMAEGGVLLHRARR